MDTDAKSLTNETTEQGVYALRGDLSDEALLDKQGAISISREPNVFEAWTDDPMKDSNHIIIESITPATAKAPKRVVLIIDSSLTMSGVTVQIAEAVKTIPTGIEVMALAAGDRVEKLIPSTVPMTPEVGQELAGSILKIKPRGGIDNMPALKKGWDIGSEVSDSIIVWIHAVQPQLFESVESLRQRWDRHPSGPTVLHVQAVAGVNKIIESLDGLTQVRALASTGSAEQDIKRLFNLWRGSEPIFKITREKVAGDYKLSEQAKETSAHLARLWAKDEVDRLRGFRDENSRNKAVTIATSYQLVTPLSGAVVLESAEQYQRAGLEPVDPATVPTIPEPEIWMLLIIAGCAVSWIMLRKSRSMRLS